MPEKHHDPQNAYFQTECPSVGSIEHMVIELKVETEKYNL